MNFTRFRLKDVRNYYERICKAVQVLLDKRHEDDCQREWVAFIVEKMIMNGLFPSLKRPVTVSFFKVVDYSNGTKNSALNWSSILQNGIWTSQLSIVCSLLSSIYSPEDSYDTSIATQRLVEDGCRSLSSVLVSFVSNSEDSASILECALTRFKWDVFLGRTLIVWLGFLNHHKLCEELFIKLLAIWTSTDHIEHSLIRQHQGIFFLILLATIDVFSRVIDINFVLPRSQSRMVSVSYAGSKLPRFYCECRQIYLPSRQGRSMLRIICSRSSCPMFRATIIFRNLGGRRARSPVGQISEKVDGHSTTERPF